VCALRCVRVKHAYRSHIRAVHTVLYVRLFVRMYVALGTLRSARAVMCLHYTYVSKSDMCCLHCVIRTYVCVLSLNATQCLRCDVSVFYLRL